jgi:hypothetical protein
MMALVSPFLKKVLQNECMFDSKLEAGIYPSATKADN